MLFNYFCKLLWLPQITLCQKSPSENDPILQKWTWLLQLLTKSFSLIIALFQLTKELSVKKEDQLNFLFSHSGKNMH